MTIHPSRASIRNSLKIAYEVKVTFYDPLPVALAERRKAVCITADEANQYKKLQTKAYPIELL